jgi:hypothetical protein
MFNKFMSAFSSKSKAIKVDNSAVVIAAANNVKDSSATDSDCLNINHQVLTAQQLIEAGQALMHKQEMDAEVESAKALKTQALKQKQELLKVTNALAASKRHLASSTASAAKAIEELLYQELDLEAESAAGQEQLRLSKEVTAASAAMTKEDARAKWAAQRGVSVESSNVDAPQPAPSRKVVKTKEEVRWEKISSMIKNQSHAALAYKMTKEQALARCQEIAASQDNAKRTMLANIWAVSVDVWGPTPQVLKQAFAAVSAPSSAPSSAEGDGQDVYDTDNDKASPDDNDDDKASPDAASTSEAGTLPAQKTGVASLNFPKSRQD